MRRYVIVGTGAAGIAAAEAIRCHDPAGDILLISEEKDGFYSRPGLAYYLTGEITERQLYPFSEQDFRRLNVHRKHSRAVRVHTQSHQLVLRRWGATSVRPLADRYRRHGGYRKNARFSTGRRGQAG